MMYNRFNQYLQESINDGTTLKDALKMASLYAEHMKREESSKVALTIVMDNNLDYPDFIVSVLEDPYPTEEEMEEMAKAYENEYR